jgi:hypothetical protein
MLCFYILLSYLVLRHSILLPNYRLQRFLSIPSRPRYTSANPTSASVNTSADERPNNDNLETTNSDYISGMNDEYMPRNQGILDNSSPEKRKNTKRKQVMLARIVSWILRKVVQSQTQSNDGLQVHVDAHSNQEILRGRVNKIELSFNSIAYGQLFISGGGQLTLQVRK